jgi:hypothetical protein
MGGRANSAIESNMGYGLNQDDQFAVQQNSVILSLMSTDVPFHVCPIARTKHSKWM